MRFFRMLREHLHIHTRTVIYGEILTLCLLCLCILRYRVTFVKRKFKKITNFFSDKIHICFLEISWRSLLINSSWYLGTPLFVDWLPTDLQVNGPPWVLLS